MIKGADQKSIMQIADEIVKLADAARTRKINLNDMKGGIITITNIGGLGGIAATPILNYPESSIISTMAIRELPRYIDGKLEKRKVMNCGITFDHRIYDGAEAARFMNSLKKYLEDPDSLLLD